jgi:hypothetical protein
LPELNDVLTSKTSFLAIGAILKLPELVQLCKTNNPTVAKTVIIYFMILILSVF